MKLRKLSIWCTICFFSTVLFLNGLISANASISQSILNIAKGGTNANSIELAQKNLGRIDSIGYNNTDNQFPSSKAVYDYIQHALYGNLSTDNTNFSPTVTNWTGGDLIYKSSELSITAANNKIKIDDIDCTTSGQGYTANSADDDSKPQIGCVLPNFSEGTHGVKISVDGGANYSIYAGAVNYKQTPALSGCDTTSMQTFGTNGAACKAAMQQGQVIVLNDTRDNQKYRVKKMPDDNVWMIDNLKYSSGTYWDPIGQTYCTSSGLVNTHNPGNTTACGYLYNWSTAITVSPSGWSLHPNSGAKSAYELSNKMLAVAANSAGNRNPVYSITGYKNFNEGGTSYPAPWLGVYSGYSSSSGSFITQGSWGNYWSSTEYNSNYAYDLDFSSSGFGTQSSSSKSNGFTVRSVL